MANNLSIRQRFFVVLGSILLAFIIGTVPAASNVKHQPIVEELIQILEVKPELKKALEESIHKANRLGALTLPTYYEFLDQMVTMIPTDRNLLPRCLEFYYLIDQSKDGILQKDDSFKQWTHKFIKEWGSFLDTTESAKGLETLYTNPIYAVNDFIISPSGWLTFNQFFARHVKPGKRPIDGLNDNSIIVSSADSVFHGQWKIDKDSEITTKGIKWSLHELLDGSPYQDKFKNGTYIHSYLSAHDYHRFHVPVAGIIKEARVIPGNVVLNVIKKEDGSLDMIDGDTYQFTQRRGLIVIESPIGFVAVLPIGMGQVSSVNLTAEVGTTLAKGEEFGYFAFGGSDIIILFEADKVNITAEVGIHYNQGTKIATTVSK